MSRLFGAILFFIACAAWAQADWRTATTLDQLNAQVLDWSSEYQKTVTADVDGMTAVVVLHFKRGPVVAAGMASLLDKWLAASETQKKSRYLAVARYFATHTDDWGSVAAWAWYRCFLPPIDARYNALAETVGQPLVPEAAAPSPTPEQMRPLLEQTLPTINGFLTAYAYPIVDTPITKLGFDTQGILVDGRLPRDKQLLNKTFTYSGSLIGLFGAGFF